MPCNTKLKPRQTTQQRAEEIRRAIIGLDQALRMRGVKAVIGPQGAVAFAGWDNSRDGITDACAYRRIMATGSALARAEIARAEQLAGRAVDRRTVAQGVHSHDGGATWHGKG
ncbi:MAG: hypothetical protein ACREJC_11515 [Tepidisphaeraceae bacterium]